MSQRLFIGSTKDKSYDCVIRSVKGARNKLNREWLLRRGKTFVGPWKIRIGNKLLFKKVEPIISSVLSECGMKYPDCIWSFYFGSRIIDHPTYMELRRFIRNE